jgi:hypothetical protein
VSKLFGQSITKSSSALTAFSISKTSGSGNPKCE